MNLYAVIYLKGQLAAAMFLWPGATVRDCEKLNAEYAAILPSTSGIRYGEVKLHDIRLACEWQIDFDQRAKRTVEQRPRIAADPAACPIQHLGLK